MDVHKLLLFLVELLQQDKNKYTLIYITIKSRRK